MNIRKMLQTLKGDVMDHARHRSETSFLQQVGGVILSPDEGLMDTLDWERYVQPIASAYERGAGVQELKDLIGTAFAQYNTENPVRIINATPHAVHMVANHIASCYGGQELRTDVIKQYPASGTVARIYTSSQTLGPVDGFCVSSETQVEVLDLPDEVEGTYYIVSAMVRNFLPKRKDLLSPGPAHRDEEGRIIGVYGFVGNP